MTKVFCLSSVAAIVFAAYATAAEAQQADVPATHPAGQSDCSGFMCLFNRSRQAGSVAPVDPKVAAARAAALPADVDDTPGGAKATAKRKSEASLHPKPPIAVITIAAGSAESGRMKALAATLSKPRVRIVDPSAADKANFSVSTALDQSDGAERAKLFTEQMHIVAGAGVQSISDLEGKVVSFGPDKGATQVAARKAFQSLRVLVKETPLDVDNALDGLSTGDLDAVVILAPEPVDRLRSLKGPGLHLVAWPEGAARPTGASESNIDPALYPGLANPGRGIRALGVDAVLKLGSRGAKEAAAKTFLTSLSQHSAALSKRGFDLIKADLADRSGQRVASAERR